MTPIQPIPLHRIASVRPFVDFLSCVGTPVERELRKARLPVLALDDINGFIPSVNYWSFIANTADREGIEDLGFLVARQFGADAADPEMTAKLVQLPNLQHALDFFCDLTTKQTSQVRLWVQPVGNHASRLCYKPSFGIDHPAFSHFQWYGILCTLSALQIFTGDNWLPRHIGLASPTLPSRTISEFFPFTRFSLGHKHCFIVLDKDMMNMPAFDNRKIDKPLIERSTIKPAEEFYSTLRQALRSYIRDSQPSIDDAAKLAGISVRTLQRRLAEERLTYRELLSQLRIETAKDLLQGSDHTITDIAARLSYSDPSHFTRAFKRAVGVSPSTYRENCAN